jgi:hypothetical protein
MRTFIGVMAPFEFELARAEWRALNEAKNAAPLSENMCFGDESSASWYHPKFD